MSARVSLLLLLSMTLASAGCRGGPRSGPSAPPQRVDPASERAAVYAAVLRQIVGGEGTGRYVVEPVTEPLEESGVKRLLDARQDTLRAYIGARAGRRIPRALDPGVPVSWFAESDWQALTPEGDEGNAFIRELEGRWTAFRKRFPDAPGLTTFSEIGFSRDGTQAIVYVRNSSAGLSGYGKVVLLERDAAGWRVVEAPTIMTA